MNLKLKSLVQVILGFMVQQMISCIFKTAFYAIVIFDNAITYISTIITNLQTNFDFTPGVLYRISR